MSHEIDCRNTDDIVCPYCGYTLMDSWECGSEGVVECPECGERFRFDSDHVVYYTSQRDCALNDKQHEWEVERELHEATMQKCLNCDQKNFERKPLDTTGDLFPELEARK